MKRLFLFIVALVVSNSVFAYQVHTVEVASKVMPKGVMVNVILPDSYEVTEAFPVVYLLHGYADNQDAWLNKGQAAELADKHNVIIVMPDGGFNSWYFDSPLNKSSMRESFIIKELIPYIDKRYKTVADRTARAITGLSMGGHGALYLAIRHQDIFAFAGSMSGGVDITPFPNNWEISSHLGTQEENPEVWAKHTVINLVDQIKPESLSLVFDCGVDDFFYEVNCNLHEKLLSLKIPHDFCVRPGAHTWEYWRNSVKYHFLYFSLGFQSAANNIESK